MIAEAREDHKHIKQLVLVRVFSALLPDCHQRTQRSKGSRHQGTQHGDV